MLLATASQLEKRSAEIEQSVRKFNVAVAVKWQNYLTLYKYVRCLFMLACIFIFAFQKLISGTELL